MANFSNTVPFYQTFISLGKYSLEIQFLSLVRYVNPLRNRFPFRMPAYRPSTPDQFDYTPKQTTWKKTRTSLPSPSWKKNSSNRRLRRIVLALPLLDVFAAKVWREIRTSHGGIYAGTNFTRAQAVGPPEGYGSGTHLRNDVKRASEYLLT